LIQNEIGGQTNKTPILGDIPFLGPLFSVVSYEEQERELVVLVTPYLVDPMDCKQAPCKLPGLETRSPDDFELFLELILEAPRGPRDVFPDKKYRPAWANDPSADKFPCGGGDCGNGGCGKGAGGSACGCNSSYAPAGAASVPAAPAVKTASAPVTPTAGEQETVQPATTTTVYPPMGGGKQ